LYERQRPVEVLEGAIALAAMPPELRQDRVCLGGMLEIVRVEECLARFRERRFGLGTLGHEERSGASEAKPSAVRHVRDTERERLLVEANGGRRRVERKRPVARLPQYGTRGVREVLDRLSHGARKLERLQVVVREHLGVVLRPAERLDPACSE
jgi:hypothetical protein